MGKFIVKKNTDMYEAKMIDSADFDKMQQEDK